MDKDKTIKGDIKEEKRARFARTLLVFVRQDGAISEENLQLVLKRNSLFRHEVEDLIRKARKEDGGDYPLPDFMVDNDEYFVATNKVRNYV